MPTSLDFGTCNIPGCDSTPHKTHSTSIEGSHASPRRTLQCTSLRTPHALLADARQAELHKSQPECLWTVIICQSHRFPQQRPKPHFYWRVSDSESIYNLYMLLKKDCRQRQFILREHPAPSRDALRPVHPHRPVGARLLGLAPVGRSHWMPRIVQQPGRLTLCE